MKQETQLFKDEIYEGIARSPEKSVDDAVKMILGDERLLGAVKKSEREIVLYQYNHGGPGSCCLGFDRLYLWNDQLWIDEILNSDKGSWDSPGSFVVKARAPVVSNKRGIAIVMFKEGDITYSIYESGFVLGIEFLERKYGSPAKKVGNHKYMIKGKHVKIRNQKLVKRFPRLSGKKILENLEREIAEHAF